MKTNITAIVIATALIGTGCTPIPAKMAVSDTEMQTLRGKTLHINQSDTSDFVLETSTQNVASLVAFGAIGAAVSASISIGRGKNALTTAGIEDPAKTIEANIIKELAKYQPATTQAYTTQTAPTEGVDLDVKTAGWSTPYTPNGYGINYSAAMKLTDKKSNKILAQAGCEYKTDSTLAVPYEKITADQGTWLKTEMGKAVDYCSNMML